MFLSFPFSLPPPLSKNKQTNKQKKAIKHFESGFQLLEAKNISIVNSRKKDLNGTLCLKMRLKL